MERPIFYVKVVAVVAVLLLLVGGAAYLFLSRDREEGKEGDDDDDAGTNRRPMANAGPSQIVGPGEPAYLNGSASSDPDGDDLVFHWDMDSGTDSNNDGMYDNDRDVTGEEVEHFYPVQQTTTTYLVTLNVSDGKLWDKATTRVTIMVSGNETPPEVVLSCRYGRVPGGSPLDPYFILTVVSASSIEMISNFTYKLTSPTFETIAQGNVSDLLIALPGSDIRFVDIIPFTRVSTNDLFYLREGDSIVEGCLFELFYLVGEDPVGVVELLKDEN
jgi:hypothetical protein